MGFAHASTARNRGGALPFGCQYSQDQAVEKDKRWKRCWQRPPRSDVEQKRSRGIVTACGQRRAATDRLEAEKLEETPVLAKQPGQFDDHSRRPVPTSLGKFAIAASIYQKPQVRDKNPPILLKEGRNIVVSSPRECRDRIHARTGVQIL